LLLPVGQDRHSPGCETEKSRTAVSPKLAFRKAGMQVFPVAMSCLFRRASAPPCLLMFIKGPLKEDWRLFAFCLWLLLWAFWCEKLLEGKRITERKRIAEGKRMAKEGLIESLH
jgi:uncharacterized membrane protein